MVCASLRRSHSGRTAYFQRRGEMLTIDAIEPSVFTIGDDAKCQKRSSGWISIVSRHAADFCTDPRSFLLLPFAVRSSIGGGTGSSPGKAVYPIHAAEASTAVQKIVSDAPPH